MNAPNCSGVPPTTSPAWTCSTACTTSGRRATALNTRFAAATTSGVNPAGPTMPCHTAASKSGSVAASGGTSGRAATGVSEPTANARILPSRMKGKEVDTVMKALSVSFDSRLRTTSAPLR
jgi:hypothetical protein